MKRITSDWILWSVAGAIALGTFTLILPRADEKRVAREWLSEIPEVAEEERLFNARRDSVRVLTDALARLTALELAGTTQATQVARGNATRSTFSAAPDVPAVAREGFATRVASEFADLGDPHQVPVRVQMVTDTSARFWYSRHIVLPLEAGAPCTVILHVSERPDRATGPRLRDRIVSTCALYARFGMPGAAMQAWLVESDAWAAATDLAVASRRDGPRHPWDPQNVATVPIEGACAAGDTDACTRMLVERRLGFWFQRSDTLMRDATPGAFAMHPFVTFQTPGTYLALMRAELGDERFGEFWRSDAGPADAYEAISGRPLGDFVYDDLMLHAEPHRPGPLHAGLPLGLGLAIGVASAVLAVRLTRRQQS